MAQGGHNTGEWQDLDPNPGSVGQSPTKNAGATEGTVLIAAVSRHGAWHVGKSS